MNKPNSFHTLTSFINLSPAQIGTFLSRYPNLKSFKIKLTFPENDSFRVERYAKSGNGAPMWLIDTLTNEEWDDFIENENPLYIQDLNFSKKDPLEVEIPPDVEAIIPTHQMTTLRNGVLRNEKHAQEFYRLYIMPLERALEKVMPLTKSAPDGPMARWKYITIEEKRENHIYIINYKAKSNIARYFKKDKEVHISSASKQDKNLKTLFKQSSSIRLDFAFEPTQINEIGSTKNKLNPSKIYYPRDAFSYAVIRVAEVLAANTGFEFDFTTQNFVKIESSAVFDEGSFPAQLFAQLPEVWSRKYAVGILNSSLQYIKPELITGAYARAAMLDKMDELQFKGFVLKLTDMIDDLLRARNNKELKEELKRQDDKAIIDEIAQDAYGMAQRRFDEFYMAPNDFEYGMRIISQGAFENTLRNVVFSAKTPEDARSIYQEIEAVASVYDVMEIANTYDIGVEVSDPAAKMQVDTRPGLFYVVAVHKTLHDMAYLLGPFEKHEEAIRAVPVIEKVIKYEKITPPPEKYSLGTARMPLPEKGDRPKMIKHGRFNPEQDPQNILVELDKKHKGLMEPLAAMMPQSEWAPKLMASAYPAWNNPQPPKSCLWGSLEYTLNAHSHQIKSSPILAIKIKPSEDEEVVASVNSLLNEIEKRAADEPIVIQKRNLFYSDEDGKIKKIKVKLNKGEVYKVHITGDYHLLDQLLAVWELQSAEYISASTAPKQKAPESKDKLKKRLYLKKTKARARAAAAVAAAAAKSKKKQI